MLWLQKSKWYLQGGSEDFQKTADAAVIFTYVHFQLRPQKILPFALLVT